ncbi:MAG TPA: aldo/keto reductase [Chloroflexota bacterium]|nr:aldo/keto reductase [Chloroflexota bacterium]
MDYVAFGRSGLKVSRLALGLGLRGQADEREAERLIRRAFDGGITLFDCANVYGLTDDRRYAGRSEEILGRALREVRDDVVITSKVVSQVGRGPNDRGASRYHVMREVERSLRRLGTDRIDVYLLHTFDAETPLDEQLRALDDLTRQGKIRYAGVCNYQAWQVMKALSSQERLGAAPLITVQNPYSLLDRNLEREMFPLARDTGLGVMAYSPLAVGLLSGAYDRDAPPPDGTLWARRGPERFKQALDGPRGETLDAVQEIAQRTGATVAQIALRWVLSRPEITVAISGADTDAQMDENLGALTARVSDEDLQRLTEVSEPAWPPRIA